MTTINEVISSNLRGMLWQARKITRGDYDLADDIVQEAVLYVLGQPERARQQCIDNPRYLLNHVRWTAIKLFRRGRRYVDGGDHLAERICVDGGQEEAADLAGLGRALAQQTPRRQQAFRLMAVEGHTASETARIMGISRQSAYDRFNQAVEALRRFA